MQYFSAKMLRIGLLAAGMVSFAPVAQSAEIKVIVANALKDGYTELVAFLLKTNGFPDGATDLPAADALGGLVIGAP